MDQATQEGQVMGGATQVHEDDNYDSSDAEPQTNTAAMLQGGGWDEDDESEDDDYKPEKKQKRKAKRVVIDDEDEDEDDAGSEGEQNATGKVAQAEGSSRIGPAVEEGSSSSEEESSDTSESEDEATVVKKRRAPSARQEAKRSKAKPQQKKKEPEQPVSSFNMLISGLKKGKKKELKPEEKQSIVENTINTMKRAYAQDRIKREKNEPALEKLRKLDEVMEKLTDQQLVHTFVDQGVGKVLVDWLRPGRKDLPNIKLRSRLFKAIERMPFPENEESIKASQIGKILNFYRCHPEETLENKRLTNAIISRWMDLMTKN